jgi:regulatory protein
MNVTLYESLLRAAYRFVSYRPRSKSELTGFLQKKLKSWNVAGQVSVEKALAKLQDLGFVDDRKFAAWWRDQRTEFRPKGKRYIALELARKGIPREIIEETLSRGTAGEGAFSELEGAQKAIQRKLVLWAQIPIIEQKKKMYTFLAQRGFSSETIEKIIDEHVKRE